MHTAAHDIPLDRRPAGCGMVTPPSAFPRRHRAPLSPGAPAAAFPAFP
ncbi:MAG: hypothetical protein LBM92_08040 [Opitutaceae bacterium]|nr:hypothetical protein [Opitutaceae bacterium]